MAVESIGSIYSVNIPGLTDAADIQAAFQAYHYGAYTSIATTAGIGAGGLAYWLKAIDDDIALLEARPSSGGDATSSAPVAGDFTPSGVPDGYIWVDFDGAMTSSVIGATAIYNNNAPTSNITSGVIWVDKDASTSTTGNPFIPQAVIAAKGDLLAGISNDTVTVLTVGSNGQYLKADSSTTSGLAWSDPGDLTAVSAGTGITVTNGTGPIPSVAIDTAVTADLTTAQTLTNKTLTSPVLTTPSISNIDAKGDILVGTADNTIGRLAVASTSGYLLSVDSAEATGLKWAAPAAGGGMTLISTTSVGTGTTVVLSDIFATSYKQLYLLGYNIYANGDGRTLSFAPLTSGDAVCDFYGVDLFYAGTGAGSASADAFSGGSNRIFTDLPSATGNPVTSLSFTMLLSATDLNSRFIPFEWNSITDYGNRIGHNIIGKLTEGSSNAAINKLRFTCNGGNFAGGTLYLYGVN